MFLAFKQTFSYKIRFGMYLFPSALSFYFPNLVMFQYLNHYKHTKTFVEKNHLVKSLQNSLFH